MEWGEDEIVKLLRLYKKSEILWNPRNSGYFRREGKIIAWKNLSEEMNRTEDECRRKMSSLLSSYRRERGRERRARKKREGTYSSRWFAYEFMKFLETRDPSRKHYSKEFDEEDDELNGLDEDEEPFELYPIQNIEECYSDGELETKPNLSREQTDPLDTSAPKRSRVDMLEEESQPLGREDSMLASAADSAKSSLTSMYRNRETCEVKTFCDFLTAKMLTYSTKTNRSVQHAVFEILVKADQGLFDQGKTESNS